MVNSDANTRDNKFGFHAKAQPSSKAGISPESAHQLIDRVEDLLEKAKKAASFKPDKSESQQAVQVLQQCSKTLHVAVDGALDEAQYHQQSSSFKP